jgi:hypothetical protein
MDYSYQDYLNDIECPTICWICEAELEDGECPECKEDEDNIKGGVNEFYTKRLMLSGCFSRIESFNYQARQFQAARSYMDSLLDLIGG